jgi:hypothetical protein
MSNPAGKSLGKEELLRDQESRRRSASELGI